MPVLWSVSHSAHLVTITAQGAMHLSDLEECAAGILTPATLSYRKLVDMSEGSPQFTRHDVAALVEYVREHAGGATMGALAIVAVSDDAVQQSKLFGALSQADRPWQIFREVEAARLWLDSRPWHAPQLFPGADSADTAPGA